MTIKEVERTTGLTIKSIRYYEEKELIRIKRNEENDYRNYTEEDIERLKLIKILRYINLSVEEISTVLKNDSLPEVLKEKSKQLEKEKNTYLDKQAICNSLLKDYKKKGFKKVIDDYSETINFLDSPEGEDLKNNLLDILCPNLSNMIIQTLIFIAPIISLFINIYTQRWSAIFINSILALLSACFLTIEWIHYLNYRKKNQEKTREKNKNNAWILPTMIISIILVVGVFVLLSVGISVFLAPEGYLFFETNLIVSKILILLSVIFVVIIASSILNKIKSNKLEDLEIYLDLWKKCKYVLIIIYIIAIYCFFSTTTFVTEDKIIYRDPLHPLGITYNYNEVTKIETGFGQKNFSFIDYNRKGQFYYRIYINDKKITFSVPSPNGDIEKYEVDTYLELEEFDQKLKEYNIPKSRNSKYADLCDLDKQYCDRFKRIIDN